MGTYNSRRMMAEEDSLSTTSDDSDLEDQQEYALILQSLIDSFYYSEHFQSITDQGYREDLFDTEMPKIKYKPNTSVLDKSEFSVLTRQSSGLVEPKQKRLKLPNNLYSMALQREKGMCSYSSFSYANKCRMFNRFLPNSMSILDNYPGKVFCGTFSKDGNCLITTSQDRKIRLYNSEDVSYKLFKSLRARDVGWSIIDVAFSPNKQNFVYSTWSSSLHLCSVDGDSDHQEPLSLIHTGRRFCVFSVVFSSDGRELLGGANDGCLYIYDQQRRSRTLKIPAHEYDVNSVSFANESSQIIYSGGDDGIIKVWDRRTLDESTAKPVGILAGHMDGITYIDSRGDGRHLISNSKDQSIKLWDVRVFSSDNVAERSLKAVHDQTWDYRWQEVPKKLYSSKCKLEGDTSVMTYRGHVVIKTLVRCRFSPLETTGQRYIYTGCGLGRVVIYDALTGRINKDLKGHGACVRDVAWHPHRNEIISSSWDGAVGCWTYEGDERELEPSHDAVDVAANDKHKSNKPRRSLRLALKKKKRGGRNNSEN